MCRDCGCGLPGEDGVGISAHHHEHEQGHDPEHSHAPDHDHEHTHPHEHEHGPGHHLGEAQDHTHSHSHSHTHEDHEHFHGPGSEAHRVVEVREAILARNDRLAERARGFFRAHGVLVLNLVSSPGSGKTQFLQETLAGLKRQLKVGVIVGDLATDNDAQRLRQSGAPVVQITTGTVCHLDAEMITRAVKQLDLNGLELLIIENVGNLVCPASYDLGEDIRVVLLSVTEGEDKPLKYPPMFQTADVVIISKSDLAKACEYDRNRALANLKKVAPKARIFETSAKTGQGMEAWFEFLHEKRRESKARDPLAVEG